MTLKNKNALIIVYYDKETHSFVFVTQNESNLNVVKLCISCIHPFNKYTVQ